MPPPLGAVPLDGHDNDVNLIAFLPNEKHVVTVCDDHKARVYETSTGVIQLTFSEHAHKVVSLAVVGGKLVASGDELGLLCVWCATTGNCIYRSRQWGGTVWAIAALDFSRFVAGIDNGSLLFFHRRACGEVAILHSLTRAHEASINSIAAYNNRVVTGSMDRTAKVWDSETRAVCGTLREHSKDVHGVAMNERHIVTTTGDDKALKENGALYIWDAVTSSLLRKLEDKHTSLIYSPIFLSDNHVLTASIDKTLVVTNLATGDLIDRVSLDFGVWHAATSSDGRIAACGVRSSAVTFPAPQLISQLIFKPQNGNSGTIKTDGKSASFPTCVSQAMVISSDKKICESQKIPTVLSGTVGSNESDNMNKAPDLKSVTSQENNMRSEKPVQANFERFLPQTASSPHPATSQQNTAPLWVETLLPHIEMNRSLPDFTDLKRRGICSQRIEELLDFELVDSIAAYLISYNKYQLEYFEKLRVSLTTAFFSAGVFAGDFIVGDDACISRDVFAKAIMRQLEGDELVTLATENRIGNFMRRLDEKVNTSESKNV